MSLMLISGPLNLYIGLRYTSDQKLIDVNSGMEVTTYQRFNRQPSSAGCVYLFLLSLKWEVDDCQTDFPVICYTVNKDGE